VTTAFPCNSLMSAGDTPATTTVATSDYRSLTTHYDLRCAVVFMAGA
jgi:hypothetical protein